MNSQSNINNKIKEIEKEYKKFLYELDLLKEEQDKIIREYREKLEKLKLLRLKEMSNIKE